MVPRQSLGTRLIPTEKFSLFDQKHFNRLCPFRCFASAEVNAGGDCSPAVVVAVPTDRFLARLFRPVAEGSDFLAGQIINVHLNMDGLGDEKFDGG